MCLTCGKHNAEQLWYLDKEKHRIRSMGLFRDIISRHLNPLIFTGLQFVKAKQPNYREQKMNAVSRELLNWFAKTLHGMQFLPNIESANSVIDAANELAVMPCLCHRAMDGGKPPMYRCIAMNVACDIFFKDTAKLDVRPIDKQGAKDLVSHWRSKGSWQCVGWLWDANVIWVCNCDEHCVTYRAPEVPWGGIPSFVYAAVSDPGKCDACGICLDWCRHDAISFHQGSVSVDSAKCKGCGLCIDNCPNNILVFEPRKRYYDVREKRVKELGDSRIQIP